MNCTLLKFSIMLKNLRNLNDVQNHELIHSGVNPYKFSNCAKGLINPDKVKWHEIIHGHWLLHLWQLKNYSWRMDQNLIVYSPPASEAKRVLAQPSVYCHMVLMVYSPVLAMVIVFLMKNPIVAVCGTILSATLFVSGSTPIQTYPCTKTYKKIFKEKQFHPRYRYEQCLLWTVLGTYTAFPVALTTGQTMGQLESCLHAAPAWIVRQTDIGKHKMVAVLHYKTHYAFTILHFLAY